MKYRIFLSLLLTVAFAPSFAQRPSPSVRPIGSQHGHDYPMQDAFSYDEVDHTTALSIVECCAGGKLETRPFVSGGLDRQGVPIAAPHPTVWVETVRVVDSAALSKGATVRVVIHENSGIAYPMVSGRRYLVLASLPREGRLEVPIGRNFREGAFVAPASTDEIVGLAAFETHAGTLDGSPDPADRIANSVVDCLPGAERENVQRVAKWLWTTGYPGGGNYNHPFGRETFPLATKIRNLMVNEPAYVRYELFQVLCQWHVFGSEQGWVDAIVDLAQETDPFLPSDTMTGGELTFSQGRAIRDSSYVPVRLDANLWADTILAARNDSIRGLLLRYVARSPDEAHERRLAQVLLASSNSGLVELEVQRLARILKRPELAPERRNVNGTATWTNRDSSLAILRTLYGVAAP